MKKKNTKQTTATATKLDKKKLMLIQNGKSTIQQTKNRKIQSDKQRSLAKHATKNKLASTFSHSVPNADETEMKCSESSVVDKMNEEDEKKPTKRK